ncbi:MAG: site-specific DNA-methyltransferase, partial [Neglectibacter timonensis]
TWVGKKAAMAEAARPITKTLRPVKEDSRDWDTTQNLYIEGDNLEVLKILQESYLGKVKMIYIDPPYNTGHDFIYRDKFQRSQQEENIQAGLIDDDSNLLFENTQSNGRYHSDWCSMIYSRLSVSRSLLDDDGAIFISISEEEVQTLKSICNEIFGEQNFRNAISVRRFDKNLSLQFVDQGLPSMSVGYEYILMYSKTADTKFNAIYRKADDDRATVGYWKGFWNDADRPTMRYDILGVTPQEGQWKWKKEIADQAVANYKEYIDHYQSQMTLEEYWKKTGESKKFIRRNPNGKGKNLGVEHWVAPSDKILRNSNWNDLLASKKPTFSIPFDSPKNPDVIAELIRLSNTGTNGVIIDFFSGSASTAQAVMQLNAEDGGHRKFIMVQLPEPCGEKTEAFKAGYKNICEIGKERIRRAGDKIKADTPLGTKDLDNGFRVFRVDSSNMKDVYYQPEELDQQSMFELVSNIKDDRTDMDLLYACLLDWGVEIHLPHTSNDVDGCTVHDVDHGALMACFSPNVPRTVVEYMAKQQPLRVVFRDSAFASDDAKINVTEIFKNLSPDTKVKVI